MPCIDCGRPGKGTRCPVCQRSHRGTTTERGYGADYERAKRDPVYQAATRCETCGEPFTADNPKTGGHRVAIRDGGSAAEGILPQCRRCNYGWRKTGA